MHERIWRPVPEWEGAYEVGNIGEVRSLPRVILRRTGHHHTVPGRLLTPSPSGRGYLAVSLHRGNREYPRYIHRLVALAFLGAPSDDRLVVCHNDGHMLNNAVENLRWDTQSENSRDTIRHGRNPQTSKTHCSRGHKLAAPNLITSGTGRRCKACHRASAHVGRHPELDMQAVSDAYYADLVPSAAA